MLGLLSLTIILYHLTWGQIHIKRRKRNSFRPSPTESKSRLRGRVEASHGAEVPGNVQPHDRVREREINSGVRSRRRPTSAPSTGRKGIEPDLSSPGKARSECKVQDEKDDDEGQLPDKPTNGSNSAGDGKLGLSDDSDSASPQLQRDPDNDFNDIDSIDIGHALAQAVIWATKDSGFDDDHGHHTISPGNARSEGEVQAEKKDDKLQLPDKPTNGSNSAGDGKLGLSDDSDSASATPDENGHDSRSTAGVISCNANDGVESISANKVSTDSSLQLHRDADVNNFFDIDSIDIGHALAQAAIWATTDHEHHTTSPGNAHSECEVQGERKDDDREHHTSHANVTAENDDRSAMTSTKTRKTAPDKQNTSKKREMMASPGIARSECEVQDEKNDGTKSLLTDMYKTTNGINPADVGKLELSADSDSGSPTPGKKAYDSKSTTGVSCNDNDSVESTSALNVPANSSPQLHRHADNNHNFDIDSIDVGHALAQAVIWATTDSGFDDDNEHYTTSPVNAHSECEVQGERKDDAHEHHTSHANVTAENDERSAMSSTKTRKTAPDKENTSKKREMVVNGGSSVVDAMTTSTDVPNSGLSVKMNRSTGKVELEISEKDSTIKNVATIKEDLNESTLTIVSSSTVTLEPAFKFDAVSNAANIESPVAVTPTSTSSFNGETALQVDLLNESPSSSKDQASMNGNKTDPSLVSHAQTANDAIDSKTTTDRTCMRFSGDTEMMMNHADASFINLSTKEAASVAEFIAHHKRPHRDRRQRMISGEHTPVTALVIDTLHLESTHDDDKHFSWKSETAMATDDGDVLSTNSAKANGNDVWTTGATNQGIKNVPYEELADMLGLNLNVYEANNASIKELSNEGFCQSDEPYNLDELKEAASNLTLSAARPTRLKARSNKSETGKLPTVHRNTNGRAVASPEVYKCSSWGEALPNKRKSFSLSSIRRKLKSVFSGKDVRSDEKRPLTEFEDDG